MAYLKFSGSKDLIKCTINPGGNIVTVKFPPGETPVVGTSGFRLYLDAEGKMDIGGVSYLGYTTVYRNDDVTAKYNGYQLSNDGSVYTEPIPTVTFSANTGGRIDGEKSQSATDYADLAVPVPTPNEHYIFSGWVPEIPVSGKINGDKHYQAVFLYVPALEEVQEAKVAEMNVAQQAAISAGVNVTLTDGTVEHFTLTDHDQTSLMGLQSQVMTGEQMIPWHTSDEAEHCKFYSNADMALITTAALAYVTWHVTYFRDLRIYIRSLTDKEDVAAVTYGIDIPEAFQSAPLQAMIAAQNA